VKKIHPLLVWFLLILAINIVGVFGFMLIEKLNFLDALYMTVITITTIGYGEVRPATPEGRIFTIIFIITSFGAFSYAFAALTQYIVSGELRLFIKNKKLMQVLNKMNNHVIICGLGRNGQQAANTLKAHGVTFVAIDYREENINAYLEDNPDLVYIKGDATQDELLMKAGIDRAVGLICALPTDADNVFIVLTARALNEKIKIVSRASYASSIVKLKKAGADNVIMPDRIGGTQMATLLTQPDLIEFLHYLNDSTIDDVCIESIAYEKLSHSKRNKSLHEITEQQKDSSIICIGIKNIEGKFIIKPPEDVVLQPGMKLIVLGSKLHIQDFFEQTKS
jgi:K+ transport systems, NAD-binding component